MTIAEMINAGLLLATIVAIVYGPIKAVQISADTEKRREAERRKYNILAALMRTRRTYMHPDHVWALNLVQLDFAEHPKALEAHKAYLKNLADPLPKPGDDLDNFLEQRRHLFLELLHELCIVVGLKADKADLDRLAYVPYGWQTEEDENRAFRTAVIDLLSGRRPLPITQYIPPQPATGLFPPPPQ